VLIVPGRRELRPNSARDGTGGFPVLAEMRASGQTDCRACFDRVGTVDIIGDTDCVQSHWSSRAPEGFGADSRDALREPERDTLAAVRRFDLRGLDRADFFYTPDPAIMECGKATGADAQTLGLADEGGD